MIIRYLNPFRVFTGPDEANPVLIIDGDRMLTLPAFFQVMQAKAFSSSHILKGLRRIKISEPSSGGRMQRRREHFTRFFGVLATRYVARPFIMIILYCHIASIPQGSNAGNPWIEKNCGHNTF